MSLISDRKMFNIIGQWEKNALMLVGVKMALVSLGVRNAWASLEGNA